SCLAGSRVGAMPSSSASRVDLRRVRAAVMARETLVAGAGPIKAHATAAGYHADVPPLSRLIRWLLFALLAAAVGGGLLLALLTVDTALSIWQRLQALPAGFRYLYIAVLALAAVLIASLGWRLLRRRRSRVAPKPV